MFGFLKAPRFAVRQLCLATSLFVFTTGTFAPMQAQAGVTAFRQAVAETAARDDVVAAFYRERTFEGIWTGEDGLARRVALLNAFDDAHHHGLPASRYDVDALIAEINAATTPAALGALEVKLTKLYLQYATEVQSGLLRPREVSSMLAREVVYTPREELLAGLMGPNPAAFLRSLPPSTSEYASLMAAKLRLETQLTRGGWGRTINAGKLSVGDAGPEVVALRNRLIAMGYLDRSVAASYDGAMADAVRAFQASHGLLQDGTAGPSTISEINRSIPERLESIMVAMERERWFNRDRGDRHVWVNLTDFTARIIDHGETTFQTRSVIGAVDPDRETPEFSDVMEYMVINPSDHGSQWPHGEPCQHRLQSLYRQDVPLRDATAAIIAQCAWLGKIYVPKPVQYLPA